MAKASSRSSPARRLLLGLASFALFGALAFPLTGCLHTHSSNISRLGRTNEQAIAAHGERRLAEASRGYAAILKAQPPAELSPAQWQLVLDLAPRLLGVAHDPFPLEDVVVLIHPTQPWIAYHLFWDDDIDFPEDNDPTDHEVVWVEYDPATFQPRSMATYFHGKILHYPVQGRPAIGVEWGKHGSIPMQDGRLAMEPEGLHQHWQRLSTTGSRLPDHPLARHWPKRFDGDWSAYRAYVTEVDPRDFIRSKRFAWVSPWANAVIDQYALPYNFAAKQEWPQ